MVLGRIQKLRRLLYGGSKQALTSTHERSDARWCLLVCLAVLLLSIAPYALALSIGAGEVGLATFWFPRDFGQYQAAMRDGAARTSWFIVDRFSAEVHAPALMYPLYVGLGKWAAITGLSQRAAFGIAELVGRTTLLLALVAFIHTFAADRRQRRLALLLAVGTLGLGGWSIVPTLFARAGSATISEPGSVAAPVPPLNPYLEFNTLGVLFGPPHIMFGLALTLICAPLYIGTSAGRMLPLVGLGASAAALAVTHPFNLPVLLSVLGVDSLARAWGARTSSAKRWWPFMALMVATLAAAPFTLYTVLLTSRDPFWSATYSQQNSMPAPPPWALPVDLGLVLIAAPLAWAAMGKWPPQRRRLLLLWAGLGLLWLYAPVPYQRRFALGVQPALAIFAATGLLAVNQWMREGGWGPVRRRLVNYGAALAAVGTSVLTYAALLSSAILNVPTPVHLLRPSEAAATEWLGLHATAADVVLASYEFSNALPGLMDGRVVYGHPVATLNARLKSAAVRRFYSEDTRPVERSALLGELQATLVALGPRERVLGLRTLADQPGLELEYEAQGVQWYRVLLAARTTSG